MSALLEPYLYFTGNCREAMIFYKDVFGGELNVMDDPNRPGAVMHAILKGGLVTLMASDGTRTTPYETSAISLNVTDADEQVMRDTFAKLAEGGKVTSEIKMETWGDLFGSLTDKYGFDWQFLVPQAGGMAAPQA